MYMDYIVNEIQNRYQEIEELNRCYKFEDAILLCGELINFVLINLGDKHPSFIVGLNYLANLYSKTGNYANAEPLYKQVIKMYEELIGVKHPNYVTNINNLAELYRKMGNFEDSEELCKRVLTIYDENLWDKNINYATGLSNLAVLYHNIGKYNEAEVRYNEALEITSKVSGERDPLYGTCLNNLAMLYTQMGNYRDLKVLYNKILEIFNEIFGKESIEFATVLNNLAVFNFTIGEYETARELQIEVIDILYKIHGDNHPDVARGLTNLGDSYAGMGNYEEAEKYHEKARIVLSRVLGKKHPDYAMCLSQKANLYLITGKYKESESLCQQALNIRCECFGEIHPSVTESLMLMATVRAAMGDIEKAYDNMKRVMEVYLKTISQVIYIPDEQRQLSFLSSFKDGLYIFLSFVCKHISNPIIKLDSVFNIVLQHKGISTEAVISKKDKVLEGVSPYLQEKLTELHYLKAQIAQKMLEDFKGADSEKEHEVIAKWDKKRRKLEEEISLQIELDDFGSSLKAVDYRAVVACMPQGAALIEFVKFRTYDFHSASSKESMGWKEERYVAFVLRKDQIDNVEMVDIGEAHEIDEKIKNFRKAVRESAQIDDISIFQKSCAEVKRIVFDSIAPYITGARHLFIAPDGELMKLPFEILRTDIKDKYLINSYKISYINTGRDLLRLNNSINESNPPVVIANPDFDLQESLCCDKEIEDKTTSFSRNSRNMRLEDLSFDPLPYTEIEGNCVAKLLNITPILGTEAVERKIKEIKSPSIFHIATHGFFLENQPLMVEDNLSSKMHEIQSQYNYENPLLRSGLALAGAKTWLQDGKVPIDAEDGLLTAEDIACMNLRGTKVAVLSACETGLGEVKTGEGVFGLRRAFILAGAKTLVISLWQVDDLATTILMDRFYHNLLERKLPRMEALKEAQIFLRDSTSTVLKAWWGERHSWNNEIVEIFDSFYGNSRPFENPFYWGTFICQGEYREL